MLELAETTFKLKFGSWTNAGYLGVNHILCNNYFRFLTTSAPAIAYFGYITNYDLTTSAEREMVLEITRTALNMTGNGYFTGNFGIGVVCHDGPGPGRTKGGQRFPEAGCLPLLRYHY